MHNSLSEKDLLFNCFKDKKNNDCLNYEINETCQLTNEICNKSKSKLDRRVKKYSSLKRRVKDNESNIEKNNSLSLISQINSAQKIKDSCLIEESPFYIHKIAQTERIDEFQRLYNEDPKRLFLKDNSRNWLPIHYAAFKSKLKIIDFIIDKCKPNIINAQDSNGNTPLHIAIEKGLRDCVSFLLSKGADTTIKNKNSYAPIHQCVVSNKPDILELLLSHNENKSDVHLGGENGNTALHTCAYHDNLECAKVLIKHKSNICKTCNNGFFPIHVAAQRCSNKVLEFLIGEGNRMGCSKLKMLSFVDGDNNKPLHAAVQFGNLGAVKLCLENGANIDEVIEIDNSTPVHVACAQGSFEILKLMAEKQPNMFLEVIHAQDSLQMTPLHKAAMFNHVEIASYLLDKGAYIDALDKEKRSPLLLAASRNCVKMACYLISKGSNIRLKDSSFRNLLHLIIDQESPYNSMKVAENQIISSKKSSFKSIEQILIEIIKQEDYTDLLNDQDVDGCTCIHYASKYGFVNCLKLLISYGANINLKNKDKQSPLHFAAKYGRVSSCLEILSCQNSRNHINEKDITGMTPLHWAARYGHTRVVEILIQNGALIYKSYGSGNNPFHEAASNGFTNCMKIIYNVDPYVLNSINKDGNTALHLACQSGYSNAIRSLLDLGIEFKYNKESLSFIDLAIKHKQLGSLTAIINHERWEEALKLKSKEYKTPFVGIIQLSSELTQAILERCVTKQYIDEISNKKYFVRYNFAYLNWADVKIEKNGKFLLSPMVPLVTMVKYGRSECLSHPLCEVLLQRKWNKYGLTLYGITTLMYLIFLICLTTIVVQYPLCPFNYYNNLQELNQIDFGVNKTVCNALQKKNLYLSIFEEAKIFSTLILFCTIFSFTNILKELYQMKIEKLEYFKNFQAYIQLVLYPVTIMFLSPVRINDQKFFNLQWEVGSLAIFLAWFNLLLYMQRFYIFGIYVVMFIEILKTLIKVIFLFSILLIGFGLVFFILLANEKSQANSTPLISIYRSIIMMMGETDGLNSFIIPYQLNKLHFGKMSLIFLALFIFLIQILLTNLLIGLAVGDIESVQRDAKLKREAMQVQLHVELERKMPRKLFEKVNEMEYVVYYGEQTNRFGILKGIISKMKYCKEPTTNKVDNDPNHLVYIELLKHKEKFKIMKTTLEKQTELLRLILNKIKIRDNESDDRIFDDEEENGDSFSCDSISHKAIRKKTKNSPTMIRYIQEYKKNKLKRSEEIYNSL